jgi:hypothetical protein
VIVLGLLAVLVIGIAAWKWSNHPGADRPWIPDQARSPELKLEGDTAVISGFRNAHPRTRAPAWEEKRFDLTALDSVWLVVAPFSTGWQGPAHIFVSFGFRNGEYVAVSVEARREVGEEYGIVAGLLDRFELIYIVGSERDLIGRRAHDAEGPVYLYPIKATPEALRTLFVGMLERATALRARPEFYNTATNNCTSNLLGHVDPLVERSIPSGMLTVLPGYADKVAKQLDLIDDPGDLAQVRSRYRIDELARAALDTADFSARIRRPG